MSADAMPTPKRASVLPPPRSRRPLPLPSQVRSGVPYALPEQAAARAAVASGASRAGRAFARGPREGSVCPPPREPRELREPERANPPTLRSSGVRFEPLADTLAAQSPETKRLDTPAPTTAPMRDRMSSIPTSEPVGFLAPLLATPPFTIIDASAAVPERLPPPLPPPLLPPPLPSCEPADAEVAYASGPSTARVMAPPVSIAPVTFAHTPTASIPVVGSPDGSLGRLGGLRSLSVGLGLAAAVLAVAISGVALSRGASVPSRAASASLPPAEAAPVRPVQPMQAAVAAPGAGLAIAARTPRDGAAITTEDARAEAKQGPKKSASSQTLVVLPRSSAGHRIYVDGRVVGSGPAALTVKCGRHSIKIGSAGKARTKDLPCGGEISLPPS